MDGIYPGVTEILPSLPTMASTPYTPPEAGNSPINLSSANISNSGTISGILTINGVNYGRGVLHGKTFYPSDGTAPHDIATVNGPSDLTGQTTATTTPSTAATQPVSVSSVVRVKQNYVGTVRGRFGFAWDRFWFYGTGGLAYGDVDISASSTLSNGSVYYGSKSSTKVGWTAGAGVEYALTNNITIRGEYLYYDLGKSKASVYDNGTYIGSAKADINGSIARAAINYKFNTF